MSTGDDNVVTAVVASVSVDGEVVPMGTETVGNPGGSSDEGRLGVSVELL